MPRKLVQYSSEFPYHVTARCTNADWFKLPLDSVWSIMEDYLYLTSKIYNIQIHNFVLMPNHFHLITGTPEANISKAMQYFLGETSRQISRNAGRINQTYGSRHYKCLIATYHYYINAYKYVYRNPVRAKLCERAEEWRYSTLTAKCSNSKFIVPTVEDTLLFTPKFNFNCLQWINSAPYDGAEVEIRNALRRPVFKLVADKSGRRSRLEDELL